MAINAVQYPLIITEVGGGERKTSTNGTGVHVAPHLDLVLAHRQSSGKALLHLDGGGFGIDKCRTKNAFNASPDLIEFLDVFAINSDIEAEAEEPVFTHLQFIAEFLGVLQGSFEPRVAHLALFLVNTIAGFHLRHFLAQVVEDHPRFHRLDHE